MNTFNHGPFTFCPASRGANINGVAARRWALSYAQQELTERILPSTATQAQVINAFESDILRFVEKAKWAAALDRICLVDSESGDEVAAFHSLSMCGMTPGLIDDRARWWLRSDDRLYSRSLCGLGEFARVVAENQAPPMAWVCDLLPDDVLTEDAEEWRPPTNWEIRHLVGGGSFTGLSGAKAATLVGITPQNFRKYTARDNARTRQNMSYATWHLLLHKLGVKNAQTFYN